MHSQTTTRPAAHRRRARRRRTVLGAAVVSVLAWSGVAFLAETAQTTAPVTVLPGAMPDGRVAQVVPLADAVTVSNGAARLAAGVKFARVDVALSYQDHIRVSMAWTNPTEMSRKTGTSAWQIRMGLFYPVHTGDCTSTEGDAGGLNVTLTAAENWEQAAGQTYCSFPDTAAKGPGAVSSGAEQGTQLLAVDYQVASLQPQTIVSSPAACTGTAVTAGGSRLACTPGPLAGKSQRTWFLLGSLTSPGNHVPPGQNDNLTSVDMFVRATKIGG